MEKDRPQVKMQEQQYWNLELACLLGEAAIEFTSIEMFEFSMDMMMSCHTSNSDTGEASQTDKRELATMHKNSHIFSSLNELQK